MHSVARTCKLSPIWRVSDPVGGRKILRLFYDWLVFGFQVIKVAGKIGGFYEKNSGNSACAPKSPTEGYQKNAKNLIFAKTKMAKYI